MKIVQIIDVRWYNACADFAIKQAQGLALLGHDVLLLANPGSPPAKKGREVGLNVNEDINFASASHLFISVRRIRKIASGFGADVIIAHRGESHLVAALAARGNRFRVARFRGDVRPPRRGLFSRWLNNQLTHGVAVSTERMRLEYKKIFASYESVGMNRIPLTVIYPGIDSKPFVMNASKSNLKQKFGLRPHKPVIGMVGRLSPVKGHRYFIEACKLVSLKFPEAQFVIAGGDAQIKLAELQQSATILRIPNFKFMGLIDNIAELISAFDIGVVASVGSEMICRVILEYYAAGLPAVASSINQISEIVLQSDGGKLVPPADSAAMGDSIINLLRDSALCARLSDNARKWVAGRSLPTLGAETEIFLTEVIGAQQESH